mmetsp:Transcript_15033/g.30400  ORF Transcript_15033/g.30400 Transcript_15033/m.30400 type:complete len:231 (+) Transcript_15033:849-1541(+)
MHARKQRGDRLSGQTDPFSSLPFCLLLALMHLDRFALPSVSSLNARARTDIAADVCLAFPLSLCLAACLDVANWTAASKLCLFVCLCDYLLDRSIDVFVFSYGRREYEDEASQKNSKTTSCMKKSIQLFGRKNNFSQHAHTECHRAIQQTHATQLISNQIKSICAPSPRNPPPSMHWRLACPPEESSSPSSLASFLPSPQDKCTHARLLPTPRPNSFHFLLLAPWLLLLI